MTTEENIKTILDNYSQDKCKEILSDMRFEHCFVDYGYKKHYPGDYDSITELALLCIEKQTPKKPIVNSEIYHYVDYEELFCPYCKSRIIARLDGEFIAGKKQKYCQECGQALDWGE